MKKFTSGLLIIVLVTMCFQVAYASENPTIYISNEEESTAEKVVLNSAVATNDYYLFVTAYKDRKMVDIKRTDLRLESGKNVINTGIDWSSLDKDCVKIFVWHKEKMELSEKYEYTVLGTINQKNKVVIVKNKRTKSIDNIPAWVISGMQDGEDKSWTLYNRLSVYSDNPEEISKGDIILITEENDEGIISDFQKLVNFEYSDSSAVASASDANSIDGIFSGIGVVTNFDSSWFAIDGDIKRDIDRKFGNVEYNAGDEIKRMNSARYTLVDFTESDVPDISAKLPTSNFFYVGRYHSYAYVRFVDRELSDVVVYRIREI